MCKRILLFIFLLTGAFLQASAQVPANDECTGAITINTEPFGTACSASVSTSTTGATRSNQAPSCASNTHDDDIWYSFTANSSSIIIRYSNAINTTTGNSTSPSFALYEGGCPSGSVTFFCSVVNVSSNGFRIVNGLTIGNTYFFRLWSLTAGIAMTINFCIQDVPAAPANDECSNAEAIATLPPGSACTTPHHGTTIGSTRSTPDPSCSSTSHNDDVWYSFTANTSAVRLEFSNALLATSAGNANLGYALYRDACPTSTATIVCNGNLGTNSGSVTIGGLTAGSTYFLRFFSLADGNYMTFDFCLVDVITPINDECSNALSIRTSLLSEICIPPVFTTANATQSTPDPNCAGSGNNDDIWFKFTPGTATVVLQFSDVTNNETGSDGSLGFALYTGTCPTTTATLVCNAIGASGDAIQIINGLSPGQEYFLRTWSTTSAGSTISFRICVKETPPVANDECASATAINVQASGSNCNNTHHATTAGATRSAPDPDCSTGFNDDDIWYSFIAPGNAVRLNFSNAVSPLNSANIILGYALYQAPCPASSTTVSCNTNIGSGSGSALIGPLVAGQQYFLRLFSFNTNNYVEFDFCLEDANVPANDECINAVDLTVGNGFCTSPAKGNLANATTSAGFGAPACVTGSTSQDIWYKVTIPASGSIIVQTSAVNALTEDLIMEAWAGNCGSLSLISCDDDGNPEPGRSAAHSRISLQNRTPGEVVFLRVMGKLSFNFGAFAICAWDPTIVVPVAAGGNCMAGASVTINEATGNNYMWVPVFDQSGNIIAEIFANGSELNNISSSLFTNSSGTVRNVNGHFYLDRNLTLQPSGTGGADIRLYFRSTELQSLRATDASIAGLQDLKINKTNNACGTVFTGPGTTVLQDSSGNYGTDHFIQFGVSSFSSFFVDGGNSALPLEFLSFKAEKNNDHIALDWVVVQDAAIDKFEIQRSNNGISFIGIGEQKQHAHISAVNNSWQYNFTDKIPATGVIYYRIKMSDVNGKQVYSKVVALNTGAAAGGTLSVYPNPVSKYLIVRMPLTVTRASLMLCNSAGIVVKQLQVQTIANGVYTLDMQDQPAGLYILRVTDGGAQFQFKVIKQ